MLRKYLLSSRYGFYPLKNMALKNQWRMRMHVSIEQTQKIMANLYL